MKKRLSLLLCLSFVSVITACSHSEKPKKEEATPHTKETKTIHKNEFTIVAKEGVHTIAGHDIEVYSFGNSIPGSEIRVKEGEKVKITFKNELKDNPAAIHWHGYKVPNAMDGVPGVTQNAVKTGESFTYEFVAKDPGTYWYHSHQHGVVQLEKGLYGAFIVEEKEKQDYDIDQTVILDEWSTKPIDTKNMHQHGAGGMDDMYDLYTINGKAGKDIQPLEVKKGDKVRLRILNAGFTMRQMVLEGHKFKVIALDGKKIENPKWIEDEILRIGAGERYDIEFIANNPSHSVLKGTSDIETTNKKLEMAQLPIHYKDVDVPKETKTKEPTPSKVFNYINYGTSKKLPITLQDTFDKKLHLDLNTTIGQHSFFTINGAMYPLIEDLVVKEGDLVKITFRNLSKFDIHPMHMHGHHFQVLSYNGTPATSTILKDTFNLMPGDVVEVGFRADNPGHWMVHCHDLHHATAGMMMKMVYKDFKKDPKIIEGGHNIPE